MVANWQPKSANLAQLAHDLCLDIGSFVFVDDSPLECAEVRAHPNPNPNPNPKPNPSPNPSPNPRTILRSGLPRFTLSNKSKKWHL